MPMPEIDIALVSAVPRLWSLPLRILFRFVFVYLVLYQTSAFHNLAPWVASSFFHVTAIYLRTGSGDTTLGYINALLCLVAAALVNHTLARWISEYPYNR